MPNKPLSLEVIDEILKEIALGTSSIDIALKLRIARSTVHKVAKDNNVNRPARKPCARIKTTTPKIDDKRRFKSYGDVGLKKSFELDCWHLLRLNSVCGVATLYHSVDKTSE